MGTLNTIVKSKSSSTTCWVDFTSTVKFRNACNNSKEVLLNKMQHVTATKESNQHCQSSTFNLARRFYTSGKGWQTLNMIQALIGLSHVDVLSNPVITLSILGITCV